jgi:hypothetical protein
MIWKRKIPIFIVVFFGLLTLFGWFIDQNQVKNFVDIHGLQWYGIISTFAMFLGIITLIKLQLIKILKKQAGWHYSIAAITGVLFSVFAGFVYKGNDSVQWGAHVIEKGTLFKWIFDFVFTPLSATMFALLAFFVASASYRAFRIRNFEATLLLISGMIIMIGRVPLGSSISSWFVLYLLIFILSIVINSLFKNKYYTLLSFSSGLILVTLLGAYMGWPHKSPSIFYLPTLQEWIYKYPNVAGARSISIGIGLGIFATSIRYILGLEKSYIGE